MTRTSRQKENKQLQGLNTRLAGLIDKVTLINRQGIDKVKPKEWFKVLPPVLVYIGILHLVMANV